MSFLSRLIESGSLAIKPAMTLINPVAPIGLPAVFVAAWADAVVPLQLVAAITIILVSHGPSPSPSGGQNANFTGRSFPWSRCSYPRMDLLMLDDLAYVTSDQAETSVQLELLGAGYDRRSC